MHIPIIIQRALITVYDKSNILLLAEHLHLRGVEIISTGKTAAFLKSHGLPVISVSDYTGFPEIMEGRVKSLHPKIYGGILGRRDVDASVMIAHEIHDIDLVVVNLYPFQEVIQREDATLTEAIENIDIGGPTLIRAAAKNHEWCTVLTDPNDYMKFIEESEKHEGAITEQTRLQFAAKAFALTAAYDNAIAQFFAQQEAKASTIHFGNTLSLQYSLKEILRYGENPHQASAFYQELSPPADSITKAIQHQGKALSFNNIVDADSALECVKQFSQPACVIVKHANPCGVAVGKTLQEAYEKAYACDPTSAFGGIIAFNQPLEENLMEFLLDQQFVEVLIAPDFSGKSLQFAAKKPNCRLLQYHPPFQTHSLLQLKSINGGVLAQTWDRNKHLPAYEVVTTQAPTASQLEDLLFSWQVVKFVKSNGIVYAKDGQTCGIGAGQMSRIFSTEIGILKAKQHEFDLQGAVMASDAFFPFQDNIEKAFENGIRAIIQPGGSKRDPEVIACANALGITMLFTGKRHFCH